MCVLCALREYGILHVKVDISNLHSHTTHSNFKIRHTKGPQSQHTPNLKADMGWLRLVGSLKSYVSFAKEPYKRDDTLQKRPIILRSLLTVATPYTKLYTKGPNTLQI